MKEKRGNGRCRGGRKAGNFPPYTQVKWGQKCCPLDVARIVLAIVQRYGFDSALNVYVLQEMESCLIGEFLDGSMNKVGRCWMRLFCVFFRNSCQVQSGADITDGIYMLMSCALRNSASLVAARLMPELELQVDLLTVIGTGIHHPLLFLIGSVLYQRTNSWICSFIDSRWGFSQGTVVYCSPSHVLLFTNCFYLHPWMNLGTISDKPHQKFIRYHNQHVRIGPASKCVQGCLSARWFLACFSRDAHKFLEVTFVNCVSSIMNGWPLKSVFANGWTLKVLWWKRVVSPYLIQS